MFRSDTAGLTTKPPSGGMGDMMLTWSKDVSPHASGEIGSIGCVACFSVYYCGSAPRGESKRYRISCLLPAVKKELGSYSTIDEAKKLPMR